MAFDIKKFVARFAEEAREHIEGLNRGLVELEKNPSDSENLNAIFRAAHTIKGSARMLKLAAITELAHRLEDVFGALREKRIAPNRELASLLFKGVDALAVLVEAVSSGDQTSTADAALCEALTQAAEGAPAAGTLPTAVAVEDKRPDAAACVDDLPAGTEYREAQSPQQSKSVPAAESIRVKSEKLDDLIRLMGEVVSHQHKLKQHILDIGALEHEAASNVGLCARGAGGEAFLENARSLHMGLKQLLSLTRQDKILQDILTTEFQEKALRLRMVPLETVFDPLHRLVRDISDSLGKEVDFEVLGGGIELDKKMIEKLSDPLVHMLRNAIDHGVEEPAVRLKSGKSSCGKIRLSATHDAGSIVIELRDDGAGISTEKIREKARVKKLFDAATLDAMQESALLDLIFLPGFSTSGMITDISGRGVGMDVVKKNIVEGLKGTVKIESREGHGSTFSVRIPLTLAIMRILLVSCCGMTFGITTHHVTEIIKVPESEIISVVTRKALRLREEFIPVVELGEVLNFRPDDRRQTGGMHLILIVQFGAEKIGFIVDALYDEEDLVIKSLPTHMRNVRLVSGVTISGRNEIISILNIPEVMAAARSAGGTRTVKQQDSVAGREIRILVVDDSVNTREIEKNILESYGYQVTLAGDGLEALETAAQSHYDLVITDVEMPRLDGFSLTERLRSDSSYQDVPIIIVTSREKDEDKKRGISVGADAYIVKGAFDQSNLVATVQNLIGKGKDI
ncbi:MAG: hybrid sensor histidine kinase/response regulator [Thermodesulfovibrio sp.]|nr:hybrid sensor histidine kinase/response regulator [Thermodesulfovibrio sp.]